MARRHRCGIDVEEVVERADSTFAAALGESEWALLTTAAKTTGESESLWFTRFWAAKEAVSKLLGTGLRGEPKNFEVATAGPGQLTVRVADQEYQVQSRTVSDPPGREYVVAWAEETDQKEEK
jgi:phosphopantetheine--protein transferase-like protein